MRILAFGSAFADGIACPELWPEARSEGQSLLRGVSVSQKFKICVSMRRSAIGKWFCELNLESKCKELLCF